jgi:hypothetical protein
MMKVFSEMVTLSCKYKFSWKKFVGLVCDNALAMVGRKNGVAAICYKPHQKAVYTKSLKMAHIMSTVVKTVNIIHASALNHRQFVGLLEE